MYILNFYTKKVFSDAIRSFKVKSSFSSCIHAKDITIHFLGPVRVEMVLKV